MRASHRLKSYRSAHMPEATGGPGERRTDDGLSRKPRLHDPSHQRAIPIDNLRALDRACLDMYVETQPFATTRTRVIAAITDRVGDTFHGHPVCNRQNR